MERMNIVRPSRFAINARLLQGETETRRSRGICLTYSQRLSSGSFSGSQKMTGRVGYLAGQGLQDLAFAFCKGVL